MALSANGSSVTHGINAIGKMTNIGFTIAGEAIEITDLSDVVAIFESGVDNIECVIEVLGEIATVSKGDKDTLTITWNTGGTNVLSNALLIDVGTTGGVNEPVKTTLRFVPSE